MGFFDIKQFDDKDDTMIPMGTVKELNAYLIRNGEQPITNCDEKEQMFGIME